MPDYEVHGRNRGVVRIKIFISMPMSGRTDDEIIAERNRIAKGIKEVYKDAEVIDGFTPGVPADANPIPFLGEAIKRLGDADMVVFANDWYNSRGCRIEYAVCEEYHIEAKTTAQGVFPNL